MVAWRRKLSRDHSLELHSLSRRWRQSRRARYGKGVPWSASIGMSIPFTLRHRFGIGRDGCEH
jgi:hypothetical protein